MFSQVSVFPPEDIVTSNTSWNRSHGRVPLDIRPGDLCHPPDIRPGGIPHPRYPPPQTSYLGFKLVHLYPPGNDLVVATNTSDWETYPLLVTSDLFVWITVVCVSYPGDLFKLVLICWIWPSPWEWHLVHTKKEHKKQVEKKKLVQYQLKLKPVQFPTWLEPVLVVEIIWILLFLKQWANAVKLLKGSQLYAVYTSKNLASL